jgi:hypothetical protein
MKKLSILILILICTNTFGQNWDWATTSGVIIYESFDDQCYFIEHNQNEHLYVGGRFVGIADFHGDTIDGQYGGQIYISKYDTSGNHIWTIQEGDRDIALSPSGGGSSGYAKDMAIAPNDESLYFTGWSGGNSYQKFGNITINTDSSEIIICKLDSSGNFKWVRTNKKITANDGHGTRIELGQNESVFASGNFGGVMTFGSDTLSSTQNDVFLSKLDSSGNFIWTTSISAPHNLGGTHTLDASDNTYMIVTWGGYLACQGDSLFNVNGGNMGVLKFNSDGTLIWMKSFSGPGGGSLTDIEYLQNSLVISGRVADTIYFDNDTIAAGPTNEPFLFRIDTAGNVMWAHHFEGFGLYGHTATELEIAENDDIYLLGNYRERINILGDTLHVAGSIIDRYITKFDSLGNLKSTFSWGQTEDSELITHATAYNNSLYLGTSFKADLTLDQINIPFPQSDANILVAKLNVPCGAMSISADTTVKCQSDTIQLTAEPGFVNYIWSTGETGPMINAIEEGKYTVTAWDTSGCKFVSEGVYVDSKPDLFIENTYGWGGNVLCDTNALAHLRIDNSMTSILWSTGDTVDHIWVNQAGDYSVSATGPEGCVGISDTFSLTQGTPLDIGFLHSSLCSDPITFTDTTSGSFIFREWQISNLPHTFDSIRTEYFNQSAGYSFYVDLFMISSEMCRYEFSELYFLDSLELNISASSTIFCDLDSVNFTETDTFMHGSIVNRNWDFGDGDTSSFENPSHLYTTPGIYTATLDLSTSEGCQATDSLILQVIATPQFSLGLDTALCPGDMICINAGSGYDSYLWSTGFTGDSICTFTTGNYWVTVSNQNLCYATDSITIDTCFHFSTHDLALIDKQITVSPNPTYDKLEIYFGFELTSPVNLKIYDLSGKNVYSEEVIGRDKVILSLGNLSSGTYFLHTETKEWSNTKRIVVLE